MGKIKRSVDAGLEFFETNLATLLLAFILAGFTIAILCRYFFLYSIPKMDEMVIIAFTWMAFFSSPNGTKHDQHVAFTVIYDAMGARAKAVLDIVSKVLMLIILGILIAPSWETVLFYGIRKTSMLKMSFTWLYMPYMYFLIVTVYYLLNNLAGDIRRLMRAFKPAADDNKGGQ